MTDKIKIFSSNWLKIIAMTAMLYDHICFTQINQIAWPTLLGRIAFPIFAFMLVEGYEHTKDFRKYCIRMGLFAAISEVPFNLMLHGTITYIYHQNVMVTLFIALITVRLIDRRWNAADTFFERMDAIIVFGVSGWVVSCLCLSDYANSGVWLVLLFWVTRTMKYKGLLQTLGVLVLSIPLETESIVYLIPWKETFSVPRQCFAVFGMAPILLYNGTRGTQSRWFQYAAYLFYPVHLLALSLISKVLL